MAPAPLFTSSQIIPLVLSQIPCPKPRHIDWAFTEKLNAKVIQREGKLKLGKTWKRRESKSKLELRSNRLPTLGLTSGYLGNLALVAKEEKEIHSCCYTNREKTMNGWVWGGDPHQ